jgi:hypothetical protein
MITTNLLVWATVVWGAVSQRMQWNCFIFPRSLMNYAAMSAVRPWPQGR